MKELTRAKFSALQDAMRQSYGIADNAGTNEAFAVSEPMEIRLNEEVQASSEFLSRINLLPVTDKSGYALELFVASTLAKRTDTSSKDRVPTASDAPSDIEYTCMLTEFDVSFKYDLLDAWARYGDFMERFMKKVYRRIALDRILIGWHGTSAAADTDRSANTALEDVNVGWIKLLELHNPAQYLLESTQGSGKITLGTSGDYKNLDALVYDIYSMINVASRSGYEVAIVGQNLVAHDMGKALSAYAQQPSEKSHVLVLEKSYGGLPALMVPGFPDTGVIVTDPENLSIYFQEGKTRRQLIDNPKRSRVEDFISSNDAYMIEDPKAIAGLNANNSSISD